MGASNAKQVASAQQQSQQRYESDSIAEASWSGAAMPAEDTGGEYVVEKKKMDRKRRSKRTGDRDNDEVVTTHAGVTSSGLGSTVRRGTEALLGRSKYGKHRRGSTDAGNGAISRGEDSDTVVGVSNRRTMDLLDEESGRMFEERKRKEREEMEAVKRRLKEEEKAASLPAKPAQASPLPFSSAPPPSSAAPPPSSATDPLSQFVDVGLAKRKQSAPLPNDDEVTSVTTGEKLRVLPKKEKGRITPPDEASAMGKKQTSFTAGMEGDYTILRDQMIGSGGFGQVFKGFDNKNGMHVAVKEAKTTNSSDNAGSSAGNTMTGSTLLIDDPGSIKAEFDVLTTIQHQNIVRVLGFELDTKAATSRIYMEWMPGGSVLQVIKNTTFRLHENVIRRYLRDCFQGLEHLHSRRIFHRDIKPANMLVSGDGIVKLSDFGTSRVSTHASITSTGKGAVGTTAYLAPEIITRGKYSAASDLWALGCSIVEMATGQPPWSELPREKQTPITLLYHIGSAQPPNHCPKIPEHLSKELKKILNFLLAPEPKDRICAKRCLTAPYFSRNQLPKDAEPLSQYGTAREAHRKELKQKLQATSSNKEVGVGGSSQGESSNGVSNQTTTTTTSGGGGGISRTFGGNTTGRLTNDLSDLMSYVGSSEKQELAMENDDQNAEQVDFSEED